MRVVSGKIAGIKKTMPKLKYVAQMICCGDPEQPRDDSNNIVFLFKSIMVLRSLTVCMLLPLALAFTAEVFRFFHYSLLFSIILFHVPVFKIMVMIKFSMH